MRLSLVVLAVAGSLPLGAPAGVFGTMIGVAPAPGGERKYDAATLRPADLKSCLVDAYSIDKADELFDAERPRVAKDRDELDRLAEAAKDKRPGDPAKVELRAKAREHNAHVASLNARVAYAQEARDRFSKQCKGRRYYLPDLQAVRNELPTEIAAIPK